MNAIHTLKFSVVLALLLATTVTTPCSGAVTVTATEVGSDVVFTYSGSIVTTPLTINGVFGLSGSRMKPDTALFRSDGSPANTAADVYDLFLSPITGFGSGSNFVFASSSTGDVFGFIGGGGDELWLPNGYVSGSALSGSTTFANESFATLGLTSGASYTFSINSKPAFVFVDNIFVNVAASAPEPSRALLACLSVAGIVFRRRRKA